jgi:hypothetical protein
MQPPPLAKAPSWAERLVRFMDDGWTVPGTSFRFGADAVLGLIFPVAGDMVSSISALSLFWLALERRAPPVIIARMLLNMGIDTVVGSIPLLGDVFDVGWKANRRNLTLLERATSDPSARPLVRDSLLMMLAVAVVLASLVAPILLLLTILAWLKS